MHTTKDLQKMLQVSRRTVVAWAKHGLIPRPIKIGGVNRWRERDIEAWMDYLGEVVAAGEDATSLNGPQPPIYSNGQQCFDPRAAKVRIEERKRQQRSRTLAAGSQPIASEPTIKLPQRDQPEVTK